MICDNEREEYSENEESLQGEDENQEKKEDDNDINGASENKDNTFQLYTIKKFISSENLDLDFNANFYNNRQLKVEQLKTLLNKDSHHGLTGLKNLGNTCYINTIVQCLSNSLELTYFFLSNSYQNEINNSASSGTVKRGLKSGQLSNIMYKLFYSLWVLNDKMFNPSELKFLITNSISQFNNGNQHDSHELLMYLLDLMHEDLNQCTISSDNSKFREECIAKTEGESDISASKRFWNYYRERNNSIIVDLFHGQLKNTIECLSCGFQSITFESFLTLPLAIPSLKKVDVIIVPAFNIMSTIEISIYVSESALFVDMGMYLKKYLNNTLSLDRFRGILANGKTNTAKFLRNGDNIYNMSKKGYIFVYQIPGDVDEGDECYPFITLIKENTIINKEEKLENLDLTYSLSMTSNAHVNADNQKANFSYPRLFTKNPYSYIKELRQAIYGFMRHYYPLKPELEKKLSDNRYSKLISNYIECRYFDETEYDRIIKEEYTQLFNSNDNLDENTKKLKEEYLSNMPYIVYLASFKDENKTLPFFSNSFQEFTNTLSETSKIEKLIDTIKSGFKIVIQIEKEMIRDNYEVLKASMNSIKSITNKESEINFTKEPTIYDCLDHFRLKERLDKGNDWYCDKCKKAQNAFKKVELFYIPKYFIIVLKRFESKSLGKYKIQLLKTNTHIKYPINNFILNDYILGPKDPKPIYELYSVSQHSGSTEGGHYASACRNFGKWYEFDDGSVFESEEDIIVSPEGYILFYRRNEKKH